MQQATGVDVYTDGEYRRAMFTADITQAVDGFVRSDRAATTNWRGPHRNIALAARQGERQLAIVVFLELLFIVITRMNRS
ncbi:MAG: hypothetical protein ACREPG_01710 [Candidatus Binatia bacterium]